VINETQGRIAWYVSHVSQYGRAELRFRAETADGATIAESPTFKGDVSFGPNARLDEHQAALRDLLDRLRELNWRSAEPPAAEVWFAWRLRRAAW
jgi:hypothetical protein